MKKKRGRKPMAPELKKKYIPTGNPMGRPRKAVDEPTSYEDIAKIFKPRGGARPGAGRPSTIKFEPQMADTRIKTLEDRIASLEALLREKGMLQENRALLESRLLMMKDYRKFL